MKHQIGYTKYPNFFVDDLAPGDLVFLCKEKEYAFVKEKYSGSGVVIVRQNGNIESWFVDLLGRGLNGSFIMLPCHTMK